jgi:ABC-type phosphate transport system substrate-binding protein
MAPKMALKMALASSPIATLAIAANSILAQSPSPEPAFPQPKSVPSGSIVRIDGSESMTVINRNLQQSYEQKYAGTKVELSESGSQSALSALLEGKIDLAAIGRALSSEEKQQGFTQVPISREKIAILIGPENPFTGNISYVQFAKIFRGEITDWSELGGPSGKIRLVDRPDSSDTRQAFRNYDIFKETEFKTGDNVTPISQDSTADSIKELGTDGISYAIYSQVKDLTDKDVRIVSMHKTLPDDPRYPFSQPRVYVYKDTPNEATQAFLGYATNPEGQEVVAEAKEEEAQAIDSELAASPNSQTGTDATETDSVTGANPGDTALNPTTGVGTPAPVGTIPPNDGIAPSLLALWLLSLLGVLGLIWWGMRKQQAERRARLDQLSSTSGPPLEATIPDPATMGTVTLPQGTAPEVSGWQTPSLPDAAVPDVDLPDASLPDVSVPDASLPDVSVPDASLPDVDLPGGGVNWGQVGGVAAVGAGAAALGAALAGQDDAGSVELPTPEVEASLPDVSVPDVDLPDASLPDVSVPDVNLPDASLPDVSVPDVNLPDASLPDVSVPDVDLPDASLPDVSVPDVDLPGGGVNWGQVGGVAAVGAGAAALGAALAGQDEDSESEPTRASLPKVEAVETPESDSVPTVGLGKLPEDEGAGWGGGLINTGSLAAGGGMDSAIAGGGGEPETPSPSLRDVEMPLDEISGTVPDVTIPSIANESVDESPDRTSPRWEGGLWTTGSSPVEAVEEPEMTEVEAPAAAPDTPEDSTASDANPPIALIDSDAEAMPDVGSGLLAAGGLAASAGLGAVLLGGDDKPETDAPPDAASAPNPLELEDAPPDSTPPNLLLGLTDDETDTDEAIEAPTVADEDAGISEVLGEVTPETSPDATEESEPPTAPTNEPETGEAALVTPIPIVPPISGIVAGAGAVLTAGAAAAAAALPDAETAPETAPEAPPDPGLTLAGGAAAAAGSVWSAPLDEDNQTSVEAAKFDVGQTDPSSEVLASVDQGLADLPEGYGESRIVLLPRDPHWAYAYWDIANAQKEEARRQGGTQLALRFYDVTDIDMEQQIPHSLQQYTCDEMARDWYLLVPMSDRDYVVEIGYFTSDARWLMLARSTPVHVPPLYPSDWDSDRFVNLGWNETLGGTALVDLGPPPARGTAGTGPVVGLSPLAEAQRVAGSIFGSMQQVPLSSYVYPSGMGMSGAGFSASMPPIKPGKFWLVADAELIVYGATDPTASLMIAGEPVSLNPDGTFRLHVSFPDGVLDYPIWAVSADGEHTRSIHMQFTRETLRRNTNTAEEA